MKIVSFQEHDASQSVIQKGIVWVDVAEPASVQYEFGSCCTFINPSFEWLCIFKRERMKMMNDWIYKAPISYSLYSVWILGSNSEGLNYQPESSVTILFLSHQKFCTCRSKRNLLCFLTKQKWQKPCNDLPLRLSVRQLVLYRRKSRKSFFCRRKSDDNGKIKWLYKATVL